MPRDDILAGDARHQTGGEGTMDLKDKNTSESRRNFLKLAAVSAPAAAATAVTGAEAEAAEAEPEGSGLRETAM